jgi:hypothetical protein
VSQQHDDAKKFLEGFLEQLSESDRTNRELLDVQQRLLISQTGLFEQNNQIIHALSVISNQMVHTSKQLDGVAKRLDYLYTQMGELGRILLNDGSAGSLPADPYPVAPLESAARTLVRETFNGFVSSLHPSQGGGRTRRR